ncbi:hypothetical protein [Motiliproteus sp. MSK22-1]|uniref:hypothetical protein n=1 Tax=Motiliproteus sp. MSK22-1 TaxID=1897630 RepID=UPI000977D861|nr:hypothetical protein [Motiliproteus sp. MSK22-1]OMH31773.1 hypothetical protein BGP75_16800 [Motiliproteus sp. MSK22-1]
MQIETIKDVLAWTRELHRYLQKCIHHCSEKSKSDRQMMLLNYLAEHENTLCDVIEKLEASSDDKALNTWCIEYVDKRPISPHGECEGSFSEMKVDEIMAEVFHMHNQVIELYRYLYSRAGASSPKGLLGALLELEQNESIQIALETGRLKD